MSGAARASADGGDGGSAVPLPLDWVGSGGPSGWLVSKPRALGDVADRIRRLAAEDHPASPGSSWHQRGVPGDIRDLDSETGVWATGRLVQHLHSQLRQGVTEFHGALVAGLPALAARLEMSAAAYRTADQASGQQIDRAGAAVSQAPSVVGPDSRSGAGVPSASGVGGPDGRSGAGEHGEQQAPSVVGPDGRF